MSSLFFKLFCSRDPRKKGSSKLQHFVSTFFLLPLTYRDTSKAKKGKGLIASLFCFCLPAQSFWHWLRLGVNELQGNLTGSLRFPWVVIKVEVEKNEALAASHPSPLLSILERKLVYVNRRKASSLEWKHQSDHKLGVSLWYLLNTRGAQSYWQKSLILQLLDEKVAHFSLQKN